MATVYERANAVKRRLCAREQKGDCVQESKCCEMATVCERANAAKWRPCTREKMLHNGDRVRESKCCKKVTVCTRTNAGYRKRLKKGHFCTFFAALRWIFIVWQIGEWEVILRIILYLFHIHHCLVLRILNVPKVFMWCQDKPRGGGVFRKRNGRLPKGGKYCQD